MAVEVLGLRIGAKLRKRAAALSYGMTAVVSLILGGVYLFKQSFMPYHADVIGKSWNVVEAANQVLISALMTVAGGGWFTVGVVLVLLLVFPFRNDRKWVLYAIPMTILLFYLPNLWATLTVLQTTPANPPWQGNVFACLSAIIGFGLYHKPLEERS
ncbi:hypothetical protein [Halorubrum aethiopicum]|uniref:hypothetical protein n=1 Tax=Halorubrum aethiopicum TaxID=1758255 RepID=UPI0012FF0A8C|nr:hypothetical protein [Halorubrum aethiopicum]